MCLGPEIVAALQVVGTITAAAGTGYSVVQGQQAADASKKAEAARKKQVALELQQKQREAIRRYQAQRAAAVSNITGATGSLEGSAYGGSTSALVSTLGTSLGELNQANSISNDIFSANADYSQFYANAQAGGQFAQLGKDIFGSAPQIGRIGSTLFNQST